MIFFRVARSRVLMELVADAGQDAIQEHRAAAANTTPVNTTPQPAQHPTEASDRFCGHPSAQQWPQYEDKSTLLRVLKDGPANIVKLWNVDSLEKISEWPLEVPRLPLYEISGRRKWDLVHLQALWKMVPTFSEVLT
jgi:hypothetical protein